MKPGDSIEWYDELRPGDIVLLLYLHRERFGLKRVTPAEAADISGPKYIVPAEWGSLGVFFTVDGWEEYHATQAPKPVPSGAFTDKEPTKPKTTAIAEGSPRPPFFGGRPQDATLRLIRETWGGWLVSFTVELDGFFVGELAYGTTLDVQIPPGEHVLVVWGGGAFFGATERFMAQQRELSAYTVCYSWYGGVKLSRV